MKKRKKKLLFVIDSLIIAGAEKSLINLLSAFDYSKYQIDLMLLSHTGGFFTQLPQNIKVLKNNEDWNIFCSPLFKSVKCFLTRGEISLAYNRIMFAIKARLAGNKQKRIQRLWKYMSPSLTENRKKYDAAIAYMEKFPVYTVVEKVNAAIKIGWIHIDYKSYGLDKKFDYPYLSKLDHIVTVSEQCSIVLKDVFPTLNDKILVIENIIYPELINKMAEETCELSNMKKKVIITIGRLTYQKGIDMAIEAAKMLIDSGYDFNWYVLGEGEEYHKLKSMIVRYGLENNFFLLGIRSNPYPYIRNCDIYVQPSRFEGKSIAIEEVKMICCPIVVTRYPTVNNQLIDNFNCVMTDINPEGIYTGIKQLIDNPEKREKIQDNLKQQNTKNISEIDKIYDLISSFKQGVS